MGRKSIRSRLETLHRIAVNAWKRAASERESSEGLELNFCRNDKTAKESEKTSRRRMTYYLGAIHADLKTLARLDGSVKLFTPLIHTTAERQQLLLPSLSPGPSTSSVPVQIEAEQETSRTETTTTTEERSATFFIGSVPLRTSSSSSMEDVMLQPMLAPLKRSSSSGSSSSSGDGEPNEVDNPDLYRTMKIELDQQHSRLGSFLQQHSRCLVEALADWDRYDVPNWKVLILSEISSELARAEFLLKEQVDMLAEYMAVYHPNYFSNAASVVNRAQGRLARLFSRNLVVVVRYIRRMFCLL